MPHAQGLGAQLLPKRIPPQMLLPQNVLAGKTSKKQCTKHTAKLETSRSLTSLLKIKFHNEGKLRSKKQIMFNWTNTYFAKFPVSMFFDSMLQHATTCWKQTCFMLSPKIRKWKAVKQLHRHTQTSELWEYHCRRWYIALWSRCWCLLLSEDECVRMVAQIKMILHHTTSHIFTLHHGKYSGETHQCFHKPASQLQQLHKSKHVHNLQQDLKSSQTISAPKKTVKKTKRTRTNWETLQWVYHDLPWSIMIYRDLPWSSLIYPIKKWLSEGQQAQWFKCSFQFKPSQFISKWAVWAHDQCNSIAQCPHMSSGSVLPMKFLTSCITTLGKHASFNLF